MGDKYDNHDKTIRLLCRRKDEGGISVDPWMTKLNIWNVMCYVNMTSHENCQLPGLLQLVDDHLKFLALSRYAANFMREASNIFVIIIQRLSH